ncbi:MAG: hypothetical protein HYU66_29410 [Armatimonadetes bacterium]|nr:hypothetical protein [Armatimonadota bacterium]
MRWSAIRRLAVVLALAAAAFLVRASGEPRTPGKKSDQEGITSNNWLLRPAGRLIPLGDAPQGCVLSPDGKLLAVANCGNGQQSVQLLDTATCQVAATVKLVRGQAIFHGLAFSYDGSRLFVAGGPDDVLRVVDLTATDAGTAAISLRTTPAEPVVENPEAYAGKITLPDPAGKGVLLYPTGLALAPDGQHLWATELLGRAVAVVDPVHEEVARRIPVGEYPFELAFVEGGSKCYVALWGEAKVAVLDVASGQGLRQIAVGKHPCALCVDPAAHRVYVANAHSDTVSILDSRSDRVVGTISLQPYRNAPPGATPNALALSPDRGTLYVSEAGDNCVGVVALDRDRNGGSQRGRIPAAWYPTGVQVTPDGTLFVVNSKGLGTGPNGNPRRYVGTFLNGLAQAVAPPLDLGRWSRDVAENNLDEVAGGVRQPDDAALRSPIPKRLGDPSPIKHCLYIIKENRTYDQVYGDLPRGNGDPKLCLYGERVTTNQHRLVQQYVLLDNFYCDGAVSVDGHQWCKGANVSDAVERSWPLSYSQRGPTLGGPVGTPAGGWIWDRAAEAKVSCKVIGGDINPGQDLKRVDDYLANVARWETDGSMPQLVILHLPNNHTFGTAKGKPRPAAMVAENDLAVGRLIAGLSRSKVWPEMAVFIVEDDAQDGPDHVDCHRSPALVLGPWVRRGLVESRHYDQCSVIRTMGLVLGLRPLSQFDAAAMPMWTLFMDHAEPLVYDAVTPEQPIDEMNARGAFGQEESDRMGFAEVDRAPFQPLNRILWHDAKGPSVPYPGTHTSRVALAVRDVNAEEDED